jgi:hypothetical protein
MKATAKEQKTLPLTDDFVHQPPMERAIKG